MYKLEGGVSYDYTPTYDEIYDDYKRGAINKNALIDLAQKRKELDYKQANNQQLKDTTLDGVRAVIGGGLEGASFHPILNIPYIGTGLGGALFEWGDSINNKRSAIDTLKNMGKGFVVGETVGAIPYAGKAIGKTKVGSKFGDVANKAYQRIADTSIGAKMGQGLNKVGDLLMTDVKAFNPNKQVAWHGSPIDFDKFDNAYIGTGEGSQAHGYGHYAAKNKSTAEAYAKNLSEGNKVIEYNGVPYKSVDEFKPNEYNYKLLADIKSDGLEATRQGLQEERQWALGKLEKAQDKSWWEDYLQEIDKKENLLNDLNPDLLSDIRPDTGNLYKLSIPKDDIMLREGADSYTRQPKVQKALNQLFEDTGLYKEWDEANGFNRRKKFATDETILYDIQRDLGKTPQEANDLLNNYGIKGISYNGGIDGEARVIFNPDDIDIVRKYYNQPQAMEYFQSINPNLGAETEAINNGLVDKKYWKKYAKDNMIGKSVDVPDYTTVNFTNKNLGKDYIHNLPEYPTLFDQLAGSKYAFSTNYKNEPDRLYDHLVNTNNNRLFDYLIEVIQGTDGKIHHNYKMMKNLKKGDEI